MKNLKFILCVSCIVFQSAVWAQQPDEESYQIPEYTPVVKQELSNLPPDFIYRDARSVLDKIGGIVDFDTFDKSLRSIEMGDTLKNIENLTIFAPTNIAFNRLSESELSDLQTPAGAEKMQKILSYHIVPKEYDRPTLVSTIRLNEGVLRLKTLQGGYIALTLSENDVLHITDELGTRSTVELPNIQGNDGVIYGIGYLLMPQ